MRLHATEKESTSKQFMLNKYPYLFVAHLFFLSNSCQHETHLSQLKAASYSSDIQAIFAGNCTKSGCHSDNHDDAFSLTTYDDVISRGHIRAGNASGSNLFNVISNHSFGNKMPPPPLPMLSNDQIKIIYIWIEQGAKNN